MPWPKNRNPYQSPVEVEATANVHSQRADGPMPRRRWTEEEIFETVADCLVEALGVDRDEVVRSATLVGDLGAE